MSFYYNNRKILQIVFVLFILLLFSLSLSTNALASNLDADGNDDCVVDGADYLLWLNHYNQTTNNGKSEGNFSYQSGDLKVDGGDYVLWVNSYNQTCGATPTLTPTTPPSGSSLLQNTSFEEIFSNPSKPNDLDPRKYLTVEGTTARGTGREKDEQPNLIQTLCGSKAPIQALNGNCLLKIKSGIGIKALVEQTYFPSVIDGSFIQNIGMYIPDLPLNNTYTQQLELREGIIPGASAQLLQIRYSQNKFQVCTGLNASLGECKTFPALTKNGWHRLKITMEKLAANGNMWSIKIEDLAKNKIYWDSKQGNGGNVELRSIPAERVSPQIGTIFVGDECLGSGPAIPGGCDGEGIVYYDDFSAGNSGGTGRYDQLIPGDADGNKVINEQDLLIWKTNYIKVLNGESVAPSNQTGDFKADNQIDGKDFARWWARVGQNVQN